MNMIFDVNVDNGLEIETPESNPFNIKVIYKIRIKDWKLGIQRNKSAFSKKSTKIYNKKIVRNRNKFRTIKYFIIYCSSQKKKRIF